MISIPPVNNILHSYAITFSFDTTVSLDEVIIYLQFKKEIKVYTNTNFHH